MVNLRSNINEISFNNKKLDNANTVASNDNKNSIEDNQNLYKYLKRNEKKSNFKEVLNSKSNEKIDIKDKYSNEVKNVEDDVKVEEDIEELEDEIKKLSDDDSINMLNNILNLLNKGNEDSSINVDSKSLDKDILNSILETINKVSDKNSDLASLINKMLQESKQESTGDILNKDTKSLLQALLEQLGKNITKDSETSNKTNKTLKDLTTKLANIISNSENKEEKIATFSNLFRDFSQNKDQNSGAQNTKQSSYEYDKSNTNEDEFLNNLVEGKKNDSILNKMNFLAPRNIEFRGEAVNSSEGITVNKATFGDDLIKNIKLMTTNAIKELTVKINPRELGQVTISLIQENGIMKANIKANSKDTYELLSQNLIEMKKSLSEQNIKVSNVNIELYKDDTTFFKGEGFNREASHQGEKNKQHGNASDKGLNELENEEVDVVSNNNLDFLA